MVAALVEGMHALAMDALMAPGVDVDTAATTVPTRPGLYAVQADDAVWLELGLGPRPDQRPLYVGKSESSLAARDVRTRFATGHTGHSTLRRTLAALLVDELDLVACPRNLARPGYFTSFGLVADGDQRLSDWMRDRLRLAVWPSPAGVVLDDVETEVLLELQPPLNLSKVGTQWKPAISAARKRMAKQAAMWSPDPGDGI